MANCNSWLYDKVCFQQCRTQPPTWSRLYRMPLSNPDSLSDHSCCVAVFSAPFEKVCFFILQQKMASRNIIFPLCGYCIVSLPAFNMFSDKNPFSRLHKLKIQFWSLSSVNCCYFMILSLCSNSMNIKMGFIYVCINCALSHMSLLDEIFFPLKNFSLSFGLLFCTG